MDFTHNRSFKGCIFCVPSLLRRKFTPCSNAVEFSYPLRPTLIQTMKLKSCPIINPSNDPARNAVRSEQAWEPPFRPPLLCILIPQAQHTNIASARTQMDKTQHQHRATYTLACSCAQRRERLLSALTASVRLRVRFRRRNAAPRSVIVFKWNTLMMPRRSDTRLRSRRPVTWQCCCTRRLDCNRRRTAEQLACICQVQCLTSFRS